MGDGEVLIKKHAVEPFFKNGYVLACPETLAGVFIDPGDEAPGLLNWISVQQIRIISIVNTHAHIDHICGIGRVKEQWDVPIYLHPADREIYEGLAEQAVAFGADYPAAPPFDRLLEEGSSLPIGQLEMAVHHTPGHSPGSVTLEVGRHVFCGDVIFAGSIGRTDLPGGSLEILMETIRSKIWPLGDDVILHPGHGPDTTLGVERRSNPFLRTILDSREGQGR